MSRAEAGPEAVTGGKPFNGARQRGHENACVNNVGVFFWWVWLMSRMSTEVDKSRSERSHLALRRSSASLGSQTLSLSLRLIALRYSSDVIGQARRMRDLFSAASEMELP
jgi:hypothetical protein